MAGKTYFKEELSVNGYFESIYQINSKIEENKNVINDLKLKLFGLVCISPRNLYPNSEDIIFDLRNEFNDILEGINEFENENFKLELFKWYIEDENIDLNEFNKTNYD